MRFPDLLHEQFLYLSLLDKHAICFLIWRWYGYHAETVIYFQLFTTFQNYQSPLLAQGTVETRKTYSVRKNGHITYSNSANTIQISQLIHIQ